MQGHGLRTIGPLTGPRAAPEGNPLRPLPWRCHAHRMNRRSTPRSTVALPLTARDLRRDELAGCEWAGGPLHVAAVARALERAETGEVDYLAVCTSAGIPVAIGGVDFRLFADAGYLWQLAVHPILRRCGVGTALVGALEERIRGRGRSRAELRCEERETGNRVFYERLGYLPYGTVLDGWDRRLPSGEVERYETVCVTMRRDLSR